MNFKLFFQSFIVGIGKILPGISGSLLALNLGIYEPIIEAITNFFKDIAGHIKFLFNFLLGLFLAILIGSKFLLFLLNNYYLETMYLFLGLIVGTSIPFVKKIKFNFKNFFLFLLILVVIIIIFNFRIININMNVLSHNYIYIAFLGFIDAVSAIIPGISGTAIYMILNSYELVLSILANPGNLNFIVYLLGIVLGAILTSYLMAYLLKKHQNITYIIILAFILWSIMALFKNLLLIFSIKAFIYLILGFIMALKVN